jgi:hypothetical protein
VRCRRSTAIAAILLIAIACAHENPLPGDKKMWFRLTAQELGRALDLAERVLIASGTVLAELKLTSAVNMMAGREYRGPAYWRLTFKRRDLIPKDAASELGAGGEIFVDVDLDANAARIAGRGE